MIQRRGTFEQTQVIVGTARWIRYMSYQLSTHLSYGISQKEFIDIETYLDFSHLCSINVNTTHNSYLSFPVLEHKKIQKEQRMLLACHTKYGQHYIFLD